VKKIVLIISIIFLSSCATSTTKKKCEPCIDEETSKMHSAISMQFTNIPLESSIKLLGDFLGYDVLRPNDANMTNRIAFKYENAPWLTAFKEICSNNNLHCVIHNKTIYFAPESYLKDQPFPDSEGHCK